MGTHEQRAKLYLGKYEHTASLLLNVQGLVATREIGRFAVVDKGITIRYRWYNWRCCTSQFELVKLHGGW